MKLLAKWGFGLTRQETREVVGEFVVAMGTQNPFTDNLPGPDWLDGFLARHKDLTTRKPEQMKVTHMKWSANRVIFKDWFDLLKTTLEHNDLMDKPNRIFNPF